MTKNLSILLGDDEMGPATQSVFEQEFTPRLQRALPNYQINWHYEMLPQRVIDEARTGRYDLVVTDLDYSDFGDRSHKDGYRIIDAVCTMNPKPLLILCTSTKDNPEMEQRTKGKINFKVGGGNNHKFSDLIDKLIEHFQMKEGNK